MLILITYDVDTKDADGRSRLRRVAKACVDYGQRVQNSVFECLLSPKDYLKLKLRIEAIANPQKDSVRYYRLGAEYKSKIEHFGAKPGYDPEGPLIL